MEDKIYNIKLIEEELNIILIAISNDILRIKKELDINKTSEEEKELKERHQIEMEKLERILQVCKRYN